MRYRIIHHTNYAFSQAVFLEPHQLRFRPQYTSFQKLEDFELQIFPSPSGHRQQRDAENNLIDSCWFAGLHDHFRIQASSVVNVREHNPFDFILYPEAALTLPFSYSKEEASVLQAALKAEPVGSDLLQYGQKLLASTAANTTIFLTQLNQQIHADFTAIYREVGAPLLPDDTFAQREGSCRDLSWMMIQLLRHLGLATRFVSGYNYLVTEGAPSFELHAWVEVFLPGAGWVGYDPTHGLAVGSAHIPVAASTNYENTMPVSGKLRGAASSVLTTELSIEVIGEAKKT